MTAAETFLTILSERPLLVICAVSILLHTIYKSLFTNAYSAAPDVPWAGKPPGLFSTKLQNRIIAFLNAPTWLKQGYYKYSKQGKSYRVGVIPGRVETLIPRDQLKWLLDFPDKQVSTVETHYDVLHARWSFTDPHLLHNNFHEQVIHQALPRNVSALIPDTWEEIAYAVDKNWGTDTEDWTSVTLWSSMMYITSCVTNRLLVGDTLCRNDDYLRNCRYFADDIVQTASILDIVPSFFRPIMGPLVSIPNHLHAHRAAKHTIPLIKERLANMRRKKEDPDWDWTEPNDYITWNLRLAMRDEATRPDLLDPKNTARGLLALNFAAIHTTTVTTTNLLLDLFSSAPEAGYLGALTTEILSEYRNSNEWSKASLNKLTKTDSAIRESMRLNNFIDRGPLRKVMVPGGITNKQEGWTAPQGSWISTNMHQIHHDPEIYPEPDTYDALRFSRAREEMEKAREEQNARVEAEREEERIRREDEGYKSRSPSSSSRVPMSDSEGEEKKRQTHKEEILRTKNLSLTSTSDTFLPFSHGRHACPGRFFVQQKLKMLLAYIFINYEVEQLPSRPPNFWFGHNAIPPLDASIKVRRRKVPLA